jgi:hypothetical protein
MAAAMPNLSPLTRAVGRTFCHINSFLAAKHKAIEI